MTNLNKNDMDSEHVLVQNRWVSNKPKRPVAVTPHWFIDGCEKKVQIGRHVFNYIDYLEAWHHFDCSTHRTELNALSTIRKRIEAAFEELEQDKSMKSH